MNSSGAVPKEKRLRWLRRARGSEAVTARGEFNRIERRQWWLSSSGAVVTLFLSLAIASFAVPALLPGLDPFNRAGLEVSTRALIAMILLFDIFVVYQQLEIFRMRKRLIEREELFRLISENAADMIAVVDVNGNRLYNSPAYEKFLGYTPEELRRTSPYDQIHEDDKQKVSEAAQEAKETGSGRRVEYRIRHKNGQWRILESTASAVRNFRGEVEKLVIVNREITERKQLEQQLFLSQKLEAVGRLSGGIAHDFNNLLGVIIGYSQVLQQTIGVKDELREPVDEILKAGERAASLTKQLLAFSRKQVLEPKVLNLNAVVSDVEKMLRRLIGENIELNITLDHSLGNVKADPSQVEQVILNLAVNARDAMPNGGKLAIRTSNALLDEKECERYRYVVPGEYILLEVRDTGCGMDEETQSHIFEPFFTTKESGRGTGLGLATVYGIIKQSGGFIWVDSSPNNGASFRIYLPQVEEALAAPQKIETAPAQVLATQTILLVEDEHSLRKLTQKILQEVGYKVLEAKDASQAMEVASGLNDDIHLLLTDIIMPGLSGRVLAEKLSPVRPKMKVLFMSGYTDGEIAPQGVLDPKMTILRKPFKWEELTRTVRQVLTSEGK
ncbi:MAG TPA: PAS domain S-box protein [Candidatus Acidoferrales bacterium]|nr:PAS domain S-box protein [Candidatus Acidoferrales bacterium]